MSDIKRKIIETAIDLYNTNGIRKITTRHIAASLSISAGNLHYHFKHTEDIIRAIFNELADQYAQLLKSLEEEKDINMIVLTDFIQISFQIINRYKFVFLHFVEIALWIPDIKNLYSALAKEREQQVIHVLKRLSKQGLLRNDLDDKDWLLLVQQIYIISDFWLSGNAINRQLTGVEAEKSYMAVILSILQPYLKNRSCY